MQRVSPQLAASGIASGVLPVLANGTIIAG
jgi:hypothetical protein